MANTTNTVKRITKAQKFSDIKALLTGKETTYGITVETAVEFIDAELALLAKKNSADKKPTKIQRENEGYKALILDFLATQDEPVACGFIYKSIPELAVYNVQKIPPLLKKLEAEGKVERIIDKKGRPLFALVVGE